MLAYIKGTLEIKMTDYVVIDVGGLTIIAVTEPSEFAIAVISDDVSYLTKIPGIGAKSAQRIILELKDKMKKENSITKTKNLKLKEAVVDSSKVDEAISALQVLGYNKKEIEKVFMKLDLTGMLAN